MLWAGTHSLHCCIQAGSRTSSLFSSEYRGLFSCMKLITYLNVVLRLRVHVVCIFQCLWWHHTVKLALYVTWIYPAQFPHYIFTLITKWQVAVMWSYCNWKSAEEMPSGYNSHLLCCLCVTVTHFTCCDLWSDTAQLQTMVHCCNMVARPGAVLPALCTIITTHSGTQNEVHSVQQQL